MLRRPLCPVQAQDFIETEMSKQAGRIKELGNYVRQSVCRRC